MPLLLTDMDDTLASAQIEPLVDAVVISSHEGFAKPDPRVFRLAAQRAGTSLEARSFPDAVDLVLSLASGDAPPRAPSPPGRGRPRPPR